MNSKLSVKRLIVFKTQQLQQRYRSGCQLPRWSSSLPPSFIANQKKGEQSNRASSAEQMEQSILNEQEQTLKCEKDENACNSSKMPVDSQQKEGVSDF